MTRTNKEIKIEITSGLITTPDSIKEAHHRAMLMLRAEGVPELVILTALGMLMNSIAAELNDGEGE